MKRSLKANKAPAKAVKLDEIFAEVVDLTQRVTELEARLSKLEVNNETP